MGLWITSPLPSTQQLADRAAPSAQNPGSPLRNGRRRRKTTLSSDCDSVKDSYVKALHLVNNDHNVADAIKKIGLSRSEDRILSLQVHCRARDSWPRLLLKPFGEQTRDDEVFLCSSLQGSLVREGGDDNPDEEGKTATLNWFSVFSILVFFIN